MHQCLLIAAQIQGEYLSIGAWGVIIAMIIGTLALSSKLGAIWKALNNMEKDIKLDLVENYMKKTECEKLREKCNKKGEGKDE